MISGKTKLVGLLGQPTNHSLSPVIHNAAMKEMGLDWCYLAMPCETKDLEVITKALRKVNCQGLNITIPHKQQIIKICDEISPLAEKLGAVNTLIPNNDDGWIGMNTDVEGFLVPLQGENWEGAKAIVLGCGGSARAVIAGLECLNISQIIIVGRRKNALDNFITEFNTKTSRSLNNRTLKGLMPEDAELIEQIKEADLIVNTTPVGMAAKKMTYPKSQEMPLGNKIWKNLKSETTLYDLIYTPRPTAWLSLGAQNGCKKIDGLEMLIQQGASSLRLWSNTNQVPINVMKNAAKQHLSA